MSKKIDLTALELISVNSDWLKQVKPESLYMVPAFDEFMDDLKQEDKKGFYRLFVSHVEAYKKLWGEPAFTFSGKYPWKTWIFKLARDEHLVLYSDTDGGTSFEYAGLLEPSAGALDKAKEILIAIKDDVHKRKDPEPEFGM